MKERLTRRLASALTGALALTGLWSCENSIYDYEGDCDPHWQVRFIYDMNMNFADAFPGPMGVGSVHLYVFDAATRRLVLDKEETSGAEGFDAGYVMPVEELPAGRYDFVAWCGLADNRSFAGGSASGPVTAPELLDDAVPAWRVTETVFSAPDADATRRLDPLYYGRTGNFEIYDEQGTHVVPVHLTKDTNEFTILLQHQSGPLNPEDFEIKITDNNTLLRWDNGLGPVEKADYLPWWQKSGTVQDTPEITVVPGMQAEFLVVRISTSRLVKRAKAEDDPRLIITNVRDNREVYNIDLLEYLLLPEEHKHLLDAHNKQHEVSDQEYLDRASNWTLQFILGDEVDGGWYAMDLHILGWHVIKMDAGLGTVGRSVERAGGAERRN